MNIKKINILSFFILCIIFLSSCKQLNFENKKLNQTSIESNQTSIENNQTSIENNQNSIENLQRYTETFIGVFDTSTQVIAYAKSEEEFAKIISLIKEELKKYHQYYDIYNEYEDIINIKTINDNAGKSPIKVSKEIIDLLKFSKKMHKETNGNVNIAMGSVLKIWHEKREEASKKPENASLPDIKKLKDASKHTDINKIIIDEKNSTVYLEDEYMRLDVGAIAKGYSVEQLAKTLKNKGYDNILLSVGGNIKALGAKLSEEKEFIPWIVGVQNPDLNSEIQSLVNLDIVDKSLVTSGNYERYYTVDGQKYRHIINPETLFPENNYLSVSILNKDSGLGDALSTAIFNMSLNDGKKFIENYKDTEAMWVLSDETIIYSKNFKDFIH